ncbi:MAG: amidohydrolase family protein [bacterium JZ-2024 1]
MGTGAENDPEKTLRRVSRLHEGQGIEAGRSSLPSFTDCHIHIQPWWTLPADTRRTMALGHPNFDEMEALAQDPDKFLRFLDDQGCARACIINYVSPDVMGFTQDVNDFVAQFCRANPGRLIPFGSVHPLHCRSVELELNRLYEDLGIRCLKIHPPHQLFQVNDYRFGLKPLEDLYRLAQDKKMVIMIHTGTSIFPRARNIYADPTPLDDVGVDFPELRIIIAHGGRPLYTRQVFFLMRRFPQFYLDISGIPPRALLSEDYFPRLPEISDRVLFGSDFPGPFIPGVRANAESVWSLPISETHLRNILCHTADRLFANIAGEQEESSGRR